MVGSADGVGVRKVVNVSAQGVMPMPGRLPPLMAPMRHLSLDLTMNIYTDPVLLDVVAAVDALPAFSTPEYLTPWAVTV